MYNGDVFIILFENILIAKLYINHNNYVREPLNVYYFINIKIIMEFVFIQLWMILNDYDYTTQGK